MAWYKSKFTFGQLPTVSIPRSKFDLSHSHKTMFNVADLIPILCEEVYPGDSFRCRSTFVARTTAPFLRPVMDNVFLDTFYFFVPSRLLMENWAEMFGENNDGPWTQTKQVSVPTIRPATGASTATKAFIGTLADYFGDVIPGMNYSGAQYPAVSCLPYRAFGKIWNDWFVSESTGTPVKINDPPPATFSTGPWAPDNIYGMPPRVYKVHDKFTSSLPAPQKGSPVELPLGSQAPVRTSADTLVTGEQPGIFHSPALGGSFTPETQWYLGLTSAAGPGVSSLPGVYYQPSAPATTVGTGVGVNYYPNNLYADLSTASATTVNDLRFAFQLQKMLERDARGGTRYTEYLQSHFRVSSPDQRLQRSEYLGGSRQPISIQQVAQTSAASAESPLAQVGAFSLSSGQSRFNKSFVEHGYILGLACIRQYHTYQQGIPRSHLRTERTDFYDPLFANIGEQPVYTSELFATAPASQIFGYNEAWVDLRYEPNRISGALRSTAGQGFDIWHFGDSYGNAPTLNDNFLRETAEYVDRTLTVSATQAPQFILDFYFNMSAIRPMPLYSVPGLIDHH